ncbi:uncharacterized protein LOC111400308 [Olea europaea var. sylvestris]|uniref:uncharacterized protein LOC111400308 n=1 Tax=Olea europaea var. sylvestris TaxID=158386 RepID=UPI000C1D649F|nr:uncharacterized protein LOC111400308 [Olea europaea var. sylvestris]
MCRAFPLTLGDKAQRWFRRLHERSVKNWNDLATTFLAQFMGSKAGTTPKERLVSIKQGRSESLKSYLSRTQFWWSVHEDGPRTYYEFLNRAEKYLSAEEATSDQEEETSEPDLNNTVKEEKPSRTSLEEVFTQANAKEAFRRPMILKDRQAGQHQGQYCRYHKMVGNDTDNCRDLKEEVESLIRRGRLQKFVTRPKEADRPTTQ